LGDTEGEYNVVPADIKIEVPAGTKAEELRKPLVRGVPFELCGQWASKLSGYPDGLTATCERTSGAKSRRILADINEVGLFLKSASDESIWEKYKWFIIGGGGGLVVIVLIIVVIVCRSKGKHGKRKKGKKAKKEDADSYSYSYSYSYSK
jgi:hypothetical protein